MKLVLAGGYDTNNLGDHASLEVFQRDLRILNPSINITLLSRHPDKKFDKIYNVKSIRNLDHNSKKESIGRWFNGLNPEDSTEHLQIIWKELATADLLVIGNGRLFVDISLDFLRGPLPYYALLVTIAKFLNIPIMIFSMTIVPIKSKIGKTLLKYITSNSDIITVRENESKKELISNGIPSEKIKIIPDAVFGLRYHNRKHEGINILENENIQTKNKKFIGVNFKHTNIYMKMKQSIYIKKLANLCDELHSRTKSDILMISQMRYNIDNPLDDDREFYKLIYKYCNYKKNIHIIKNEYHLMDTLSLYQCCQILISMRRHGIISAATQNVPCFSISGEKNTSYAANQICMKKNNITLECLFKNQAFDKIIDAYHDNRITIRQNKIIKEISPKTKEYASIALNFCSKHHQRPSMPMQ